MMYRIIKNQLGEMTCYGEDNGMYEPTIPVGHTMEIVSVLPEFTDAELMDNAVLRFESTVDSFIQSKIDTYNKANNVKFKDIDAFTKYAMNTASAHNVIANKFIVYADKIWKAVRDYQATATTIPTDAQFKAVLDGVVF